MRLKTRFSLIGVGIVLFLIATPLLVLYARGFKFDFNTRQIVKTGALVVKTEPTKADVFLNDKKQADPTPSTIRFLLPGDYTVRVEKSDYQPWTKRFSLRSQLVTWAAADRDTITLFYDQIKLSKSWNVLQASISKLGDEIVFLDENQKASSINTVSGDVTSLGGIAKNLLAQIGPGTSVVWQNSSQVFELFQSRSKWGLTDKQITQIQKAETNGNHSVALVGTDLLSLDNASPVVLAKSVNTFTLDGNNLWYTQGLQLKQLNLNTDATQIISSSVPASVTSQLIRGNNQIYAILDQNLYVLNDSFEKIYGPVNSANFDPISKQLMFTNSNEIWLYDSSNKTTQLILRSSSEIKNPSLNWATGYIFFLNENKIKAIEVDGRDHRNIYTITDDIGIGSSFAVSADGKTLYTFNNSLINQYEIR